MFLFMSTFCKDKKIKGKSHFSHKHPVILMQDVVLGTFVLPRVDKIRCNF